jgi:mannose-6-phosphate isomerase-like protein (cupin superfamily)
MATNLTRSRLLLAVVFLAVIGAVAVGSGPRSDSAAAPAGRPAGGYVVGPRDGEALVGPNGGILVKVDPRTGSTRLAMGTQQVLAGKGIQVHRHEHEDEILFVHSGEAVGIVGDERTRIEAGSTVYIPQGVWHGVENPGGEVNLVWVVSPPGLEGFFRDTRSAPREPAKALSAEQLEDIRRKHGMQVRPVAPLASPAPHRD